MFCSESSNSCSGSCLGKLALCDFKGRKSIGGTTRPWPWSLCVSLLAFPTSTEGTQSSSPLLIWKGPSTHSRPPNALTAPRDWGSCLPVGCGRHQVHPHTVGTQSTALHPKSSGLGSSWGACDGFVPPGAGAGGSTGALFSRAPLQEGRQSPPSLLVGLPTTGLELRSGRVCCIVPCPQCCLCS